MASIANGSSHLQQQEISHIGAVLENLESWLSTAQFSMELAGDLGRCVDNSQRARLGPLFAV